MFFMYYICVLHITQTLQAMLCCPEFLNLITELPPVNKKEISISPLLDSMFV